MGSGQVPLPEEVKAGLGWGGSEQQVIRLDVIICIADLLAWPTHKDLGRMSRHASVRHMPVQDTKPNTPSTLRKYAIFACIRTSGSSIGRTVDGSWMIRCIKLTGWSLSRSASCDNRMDCWIEAAIATPTTWPIARKRYAAEIARDTSDFCHQLDVAWSSTSA